MLGEEAEGELLACLAPPLRSSSPGGPQPDRVPPPALSFIFSFWSIRLLIYWFTCAHWSAMLTLPLASAMLFPVYKTLGSFSRPISLWYFSKSASVWELFLILQDRVQATYIPYYYSNTLICFLL